MRGDYPKIIGWDVPYKGWFYHTNGAGVLVVFVIY